MKEIKGKLSRKEKRDEQPKHRSKKAKNKGTDASAGPRPSQTTDDAVRSSPQIYVVRERPRSKKKQDLNPDIVVEIFKRKEE